MRVVPGVSMPSLVRSRQEQLEQLQAHRDHHLRDMVDNAAIMAGPQLMCTPTPPPGGQIVPALIAPNAVSAGVKPGQPWHQQQIKPYQGMAVQPRTLKALLIQQMRDLIPPVVWENVYRTDEAHIGPEDCELIKLTFYNDQSIKLKVRLEEDTTMMGGINVITPICDDFEEWCATAVMTCDAGEDVWERPKPEQSAGLTASQVRAQQLQGQQQMQQLGGGAFSGSGQAGAFGQGLAAGGLGIFGLTK